MEKSPGKLEKSILLVRGAWRSLWLDKKLATIPILTFGLTILIMLVIVGIGFLNPWGEVYSVTSTSKSGLATSLSLMPLGYVLLIIMALLTSFVSSLGVGAVIHGAIERFKGNSPTIRDSLSAAWKRKIPLFGFVLFSFTIGYIINQIASRIPYFGGLIIGWLAGAAWGIASFFALPIIIEDEKFLNPIEATKKSLSIMKQIWGESLATAVGIGAFEFLVIILYTVFVTIGAIIVGLMGNFTSSLIVPGIILGTFALITLFAIVFVFSILEIFVKAALYYYATTGESPVAFDKNILRQAFTTKKAKKVFSL